MSCHLWYASGSNAAPCFFTLTLPHCLTRLVLNLKARIRLERQKFWVYLA